MSHTITGIQYCGNQGNRDSGRLIDLLAVGVCRVVSYHHRDSMTICPECFGIHLETQAGSGDRVPTNPSLGGTAFDVRGCLTRSGGPGILDRVCFRQGSASSPRARVHLARSWDPRGCDRKTRGRPQGRIPCQPVCCCCCCCRIQCTSPTRTSRLSHGDPRQSMRVRQCSGSSAGARVPPAGSWGPRGRDPEARGRAEDPDR